MSELTFLFDDPKFIYGVICGEVMVTLQSGKEVNRKMVQQELHEQLRIITKHYKRIMVITFRCEGWFTFSTEPISSAQPDRAGEVLPQPYSST